MSSAAVVMALNGLNLFCFVVGGQNETENMCATVDNSSLASCQAASQEDLSVKYNGYYALLMIGNILLGIGAAPMFTIGLSYIDENCKPKMSSFYISMYLFLYLHSVSINSINIFRP